MPVCFLNKDIFLSDTGQPIKILIADGKVSLINFQSACECEGLIAEGFNLKRVTPWFVKEQSDRPGYYDETYPRDPIGKFITTGRFVKNEGM